MTVHYAILFTVEVLHEYYPNGRTDDFGLAPSADTERLFESMGILWRKSGNRFVALIKATGVAPNNFTPSVNSPSEVPPVVQFRKLFGEDAMRFYLVPKNPGWTAYTNLSTDTVGKTYYFNNAAGNAKAGALYLSQPSPALVAGMVYEPGQMVSRPTGMPVDLTVYEAVAKHTSSGASELADTSRWVPKGLRFAAKPLKLFTVGQGYRRGDWVTDTAGNVFQALGTTVAGSAADLSNAALWKPRGKGEAQYPGPLDQIAYSTATVRVNLAAPASETAVAVYGFNYDAAAPAFNVPIRPPVKQSHPVPVSQLSVNMQGYRAGRYRLQVNGQEKMVYYDPAFEANAIAGVVEIFSYLPGSNEYAFLNTDETIRPVDYAIHFAARRVLWRYRRKDSRAQAINDAGPTHYDFTLRGNDFVSNRPILLSQEAVDTLELTFNNSDFKLSPLPNPPVGRLGRYRQDEFDYFSTELFLNY